MNIPSTLLTADEVAQRLRLPKQRIWRMARNGDLPAIRVTERNVRFDPADLERWIDQHRASRLRAS